MMQPIPLQKLDAKAIVTLPYYLCLPDEAVFQYRISLENQEINIEYKVVQPNIRPLQSAASAKAKIALKKLQVELKKGEWNQIKSPDWNVNGTFTQKDLTFNTSLEITIKSDAAALHVYRFFVINEKNGERNLNNESHYDKPFSIMGTSYVFATQLLQLINRFLYVYSYVSKDYEIQSIHFSNLMQLEFNGTYGSEELTNFGLKTIVQPSGYSPINNRKEFEKQISNRFFTNEEGKMYIDAQRFLMERRAKEALLLSSTACELFLKELYRFNMLKKGTPENEVNKTLEKKLYLTTLLGKLLSKAIGKEYSQIKPLRYHAITKEPDGAKDIRNKLVHGKIYAITTEQMLAAAEEYLGIIDDLIKWFN